MAYIAPHAFLDHRACQRVTARSQDRCAKETVNMATAGNDTVKDIESAHRAEFAPPQRLPGLAAPLRCRRGCDTPPARAPLARRATGCARCVRWCGRWPAAPLQVQAWLPHACSRERVGMRPVLAACLREFGGVRSAVGEQGVGSVGGCTEDGNHVYARVVARAAQIVHSTAHVGQHTRVRAGRAALGARIWSDQCCRHGHNAALPRNACT